MKQRSLFVSTILVLLLFSVLAQGVSFQFVQADNQNFASVQNSSVSDDWSMFHHDLMHTGSSTSLVANDSLLWKFATSDRIRSSAAVVNGVVYDGSNNGYVYALNATSGSVIWQYYSGSNVESSPAVVGNDVYIGILLDGYNGYVCALSAATGSVIWRFATNSGIESSPTVVNGIVYVGSYYGYIYALNASNGTLIWSYLTGGSAFSSPAVVNGVVYVGSADGCVYALNAFNGSRIWSFKTGGIVYSSPAVVNNIVYVGSQDRNVYALNASGGSQIWNYWTGGYVEASPAVVSGVVYVNSGNGCLAALNDANGSLVWSVQAGFGPRNSDAHSFSSPAVVGNVVYVGSYDGYMLSLKAADGTIIWAYRMGTYVFSSPAVDNGVVYVGSFDGNIYALGALIAPTLTSSQLINIVLETRIDGQASMTAEKTHTDPYSAKLNIPLNATQGSCALALYPYNNSLNSLSSFSVCTSFTTAVPRFVIYVDNNSDGLTDFILLSDYQSVSNGDWHVTTGGNNWGWTQANYQLDNYGTIWNQLAYWKNLYGNFTVLYVGIALEYWAVYDRGGSNQPLYADEIIINGVTYNLAYAPNSYSGPNVDDWSMYRHDVQRIGLSSSPVSNGKLLWQFNTALPGFDSVSIRLRSSPAVANGMVYFASNNSYFYALNATSGSIIWKFFTVSIVDSSPAVVGGIVYFGLLPHGLNSCLDALNATDGSLIWQFTANTGIESSPAVVNGVVYAGSTRGYVYALNATSGALIWSYLTGGQTFSSPAICDGVVYIGSSDGRVYALKASTGALLWSFQTGDVVYSSPSVVNGVVYSVTDYGTVYALRTSDGSVVWQAYVGSGSDHDDSSPAVSAGMVYVGARNGYYAFNATDGRQIWFFTSPYSARQTTGFFYSSPAVADNVVYVGSVDSYVFALNAFNAAIIWSYHTGGFLFSSPAIYNGVVYIGSYDGYVYALGTQSYSTTTPTPAPTVQPTSTPTVTPAPNATSHSTLKAVILPDPTPNRDPVSISTPQPSTRPMVAAPLNNNGSVNWVIFGGITGTEVFAVISLYLAFKRNHGDFQ